MKKTITALMAMLILFSVLLVSCDPSPKEMASAYYTKAREAFRLSVGVALPDLEGLDFKPGDPEAYNAAMKMLDDVIAAGGSHDFSFTFNEGITYSAYIYTISPISIVFGNQVDGFPTHYQGEDINYWIKDGVSVMVKYKLGEILDVIVHEADQHPPVNEALTYIDRQWDGERIVETEKTITNYYVVDANTTKLDNSWYVVKDNTTITDRIVVSGTSYLILCNGATLNAKKGISVVDGNSLYIYGQEDNFGKLTIDDCDEYFAGIGGDHDRTRGTGGNVIICGGEINTKGGDYGAGIGGGYNAAGGTVTVNGGIVRATGGLNAAGIGGGDLGKGGDVGINYGIVWATGGLSDLPNSTKIFGAGIGGGFCAEGGRVTINGGYVHAAGGNVPDVYTATARKYSAGIGGGFNFGELIHEGILKTGPRAVLMFSQDDSDYTKYPQTTSYSPRYPYMQALTQE